MEYRYNISSFQISLTLTTAQLEGNEWRKEWIPFSAFLFILVVNKFQQWDETLLLRLIHFSNVSNP